MKQKKFIIGALLVLGFLAGIWTLKAAQQEKNENPTAKSIRNPLRAPPEPALVIRRDEEFKKSEEALRSFDPKVESSLLDAIRFYRQNPTDATLVTFENFSSEWLNARIAEIDSDACDRYAEAKPEFQLVAGQLDDVCSLGFKDGFFLNNFAQNASSAGKRFLELRDAWGKAEFGFVANAKVILLAETWLQEFGDSNVLFGQVRETYSIGLNKVFKGVSDGFMSRESGSDERNANADALQAYRLLMNEGDNGFAGYMAREALEMLERNENRFNDEIDERLERLLESGE